MHASFPPYTKQQPTGAYRAPAEMPESERKLRTALAYVNHARDLITEALAIQPTSCKGQNQPEGCAPERIPKWDPKWVETCPQRARPMHAETMRDHDERLAGGESHL